MVYLLGFLFLNAHLIARLANNKFTSILNYGHKPNILFNVNEHTLQIKMNSGIDKEKIIY